MAEYSIITKIDPSGAVAGATAVKQQLQGIDAAAQSTTRSLGTMTAAQFRAAGGVAGLEAATRGAAASQAQIEAATMRVLSAVDREAAGMQKLNALLNDAKVAHAAGAISADQLAKTEALVAAGATGAAQAHGRMTLAGNQSRIAMMEVEHAVRGSADALAAGANPLTVFATHVGMLGQAAQIGGGALGKLGAFMASGWGLAAIVAATAMLPLIANLFKSNDLVDKATKKLEEDAKQAAATAKAHDAFSASLAGEEDALRRNKEALDKLDEANKSSAEQALFQTQLAIQRIKNTESETRANLTLAQSLLDIQKIRASGPGQQGELAAMGVPQKESEVLALQDQIASMDKDLAEAQGQYREALSQYAVEAGSRDPADVIKRKYEGPDGLIEQARRAAQAASDAAAAAGNEVKAHQLVTTELTKQIELLHQKEKAEIDAEKRAEADAKRQGEILALPISGGRITSRFGQIESGVGVGPHVHQGVDIATPVGTPVYARAGGVVDFARLQGGYGNVIQINFGGGVTSRYGHLSRFNVKPGDVVEAGDIIAYSGGARGAPGSGDATGPHLHYEERVGGRPVNPLTTKVQTDTEGAQAEGYKRAETAAAEAARKADAEKDFVSRAIDAANEQGLPKIQTLQARIAKIIADYKRQFNAEMSKADQQALNRAMTDADAREIAQHFKDAYLDPLERLSLLQGTTGESRKVLNAQIEESQKLGRALTPVEAQEIDNSIRQGDALQRQSAILEQVRKPIEDYKNQIADLTALLQRGSISQTEFNARVAALGQTATGLVKGVLGVDPKSRKDYSDVAAFQEEDARYKQQLADFETYRQQLMALGIDFDALEEAAHRQHIQNLNDIDMARRQTQLAAASSIADSLASIAENSVGKQSAVYRTLYAISKAFTIAQAALALYQNVAKAMAIGFPQNLPFIAAAFAQGATIMAAIHSVAAPGFQSGGYTGDAGTGEVAGVVHGREFVVNADATSRNRALLEAINSGALSASSRSTSAGGGSAFGSRPLSVTVINQAPGVEHEVQRGLTEDEVVVVAKRVVRQDAPGTVARDMSSANSPTSKAVERNFNAPRKRR